MSVEKLIRGKCSEQTLNGLERVLFLKQIAATQFSAFGSALIILSMGLTTRGFSEEMLFVLPVGMALCFWFYIYKARQQNAIIHGLLNLEAESKNSPPKSQKKGCFFFWRR